MSRNRWQYGVLLLLVVFSAGAGRVHALSRFLPVGAVAAPPLLVVVDDVAPAQRQVLLDWLASAHQGARPYPDGGLVIGLVAAVPDEAGVIEPRVLLPPVPLQAETRLGPMQRYRQVLLVDGSVWSESDQSLYWRLPVPAAISDVHWQRMQLQLPWLHPVPEMLPLSLLSACTPWPDCNHGQVPVWQGELPVQQAGQRLQLDLLPIRLWHEQPEPAAMTWRLGPLPPDVAGPPPVWQAAQPALWQLSWQEPAIIRSGLEHWQRALSGLLGALPAEREGGVGHVLAAAMDAWLAGASLPQEGGSPVLAQPPSACGRSDWKALGSASVLDSADWSYWRDAALAPGPFWLAQYPHPGPGWLASVLSPVPGQSVWPAALYGDSQGPPPVAWPPPDIAVQGGATLQAGILKVLPAATGWPLMLLWAEGSGRVVGLSPALEQRWQWMPASMPPTEEAVPVWPLPGPLDWWLTPSNELIGLARGRLHHLQLQGVQLPRTGPLESPDWPVSSLTWLPASAAGAEAVLLAGEGPDQLQLVDVRQGHRLWQWAPSAALSETPAGFRHPWVALTLADGRQQAYGIDMAGQLWRLQWLSSGPHLHRLGQLPQLPPTWLQRLPPLAVMARGTSVRLAVLAQDLDGQAVFYVFEDHGQQRVWQPADFHQLPWWPTPKAGGWRHRLPAGDWLASRPLFHGGDLMLPVQRWQARQSCAPPEAGLGWYRLSWQAASAVSQPELLLASGVPMPLLAPRLDEDGRLQLSAADGQEVRLGPVLPTRWRQSKQRLPAW